MKKFIITAIALTLLSGCTNNLPSKKTVSIDENWREAQEPYSDNVVCTLIASSVITFEEDKIGAESSIDEKPTTLTFVDINSNEPSMVGNRGDKSPLLKIDQGSFIYLLEETEVGNLNVFTLFRDKNIMLMSKQYDFFGTPFGLLMMGDCLSGV